MKYRVHTDFEVNYPHPLILAEGDSVQLIREDAQWPGWVWTSRGESSGWIPKSCLCPPEEQKATVKEAFDGTELSAKRGETLEGLNEISGWILCRNEEGKEGWFPLFNLKPLVEEA